MPYLMTRGDAVIHIKRDDYWQDEWGDKYDELQLFLRGERINPNFLPKTGYLDSRAKTYPPLMALPFWVCSDEVRKVIEELEPNTHQFTPYAVRKSKRGEVAVTYNIINICNSLESLDWERSNPDVVICDPDPYPDGGKDVRIYTTALIAGYGPLALRDDAIKGYHMWIDHFDRRYSRLFISDEMYEALQPFVVKKYLNFYKTI